MLKDKYIYIEVNHMEDPIKYEVYSTLAALRTRYKTRAAIHSTDHKYYGYRIDQRLTLKF